MPLDTGNYLSSRESFVITPEQSRYYVVEAERLRAEAMAAFFGAMYRGISQVLREFSAAMRDGIDRAEVAANQRNNWRLIAD